MIAGSFGFYSAIPARDHEIDGSRSREKGFQAHFDPRNCGQSERVQLWTDGCSPISLTNT
jgi:hypothetical protein